MPTFRIIVLLPDMFEPLTTSSRSGWLMAMLFVTRRSAGISGCPSSSATNTGPSATCSGIAYAGCSDANDASDPSASISATASIQSPMRAPERTRHRSIASATCAVQRSITANGAKN